MKKLIGIIVITVLLSGCAALELADMIFDDDCLYRGTVESVYHYPEDGKTHVNFEGSKSITCVEAEWVDVGDWIEVRRRDVKFDNRYFSGCEFSR